MRQDLPPELQGGLSSELLEARKERWSRIQKSSSYDPDWLNPSKLQKSMQWLEFGSPLRDALVSAASIIHKDPLHRSRFHYFRDLFQSEDQLKQHPIAAWPLYEGEPLLSLLYPLMFLSLVGDIQQFNDSKGIAEKITKETLQDLLVWLEHHYNQKGYYTLHQASNWIRHHFVGRIFRLGRLQFLMDQFSLPAQIFRRKNENPLFVWNDGRTYSLQKGRIGEEIASFNDATSLRIAGEGETALSIHIPAIGALKEEECRESIALSDPFFKKHFPDFSWTFTFSHSWLFDPQLAERMPDSNVARFQKFFYLYDFPGAGDAQFYERIFGNTQKPDLATVPQTTLQKVILDHLRDGGEWKMRGAICLRAK